MASRVLAAFICRQSSFDGVKLNASGIVTTVTRRQGTPHSVKFDGLQLVCVVSEAIDGEGFWVVLRRDSHIEEKSPKIFAKSAANPLIITLSLRDVALPPAGRHTFELEYENGERERLCSADVLEIPTFQRIYA